MKHEREGSFAVILLFVLLLFPLFAQAQELDFGNDRSLWSNDGECDDPRFEGEGMASSLSSRNEGRDASDCRELYEAGRINLIGEEPAVLAARDALQAADALADDDVAAIKSLLRSLLEAVLRIEAGLERQGHI